MFEPGSQVGRYEIQRRLGRGGMGAVYVAHDPVLGRMVAIKVFSGDLDMPDARERFSREARAAAALNHPNIVTVYDFGEYESQPFIVMEYVPGETLAGLIRRKTLIGIADKLRWMEELCAGAGYAHQMHLVHRDIKPANLMIDRSGRLKILDFGIARMLGIASNTSVMIGTPGYMAPEQITGDPVDHRADQFSIGVVFYELLAYTEAFPGDTLPMITHRILTEEPVPLNRLAADAPPALVSIIHQAMRKNSAERFPDCEALRLAIARVRKEYSSSAAWNAPTIVVGRDTPPPPAGTRGTGSARRREGDAVGVAQLTPPPDPRRTDREALARRRAIQLEAALQDARQFLAQDQLESALDACQLALTFDENHAGALQLEEEIEAALRARDAAAHDSVMTAAAPLPEPGDLPGLAASEAVTRADAFAPQGLMPAAPGAVTDRTALRLPTAPADATIVAPPRRTPAPTTPPAPPVAPEAQAPPRPGTAARQTRSGTAQQSPAKQQAGRKAAAPTSVPVSKTTAFDTMMAGLVARLEGIAASTRSIALQIPRDKRALALGSAAGVLVLIAAGVLLLTGGPAPGGTLVVDAVPWASITAIESEDGERVALPSPAATPLSIPLPVGSYRILLAGPPPESQSREITVRVDAGVATVAPPVRFRAVTPEEYFEQYLAAPAAGPAAAAPEGGPEAETPVAPPSAPATAGAGQ